MTGALTILAFLVPFTRRAPSTPMAGTSCATPGCGRAADEDGASRCAGCEIEHELFHRDSRRRFEPID